MYYRESAPEEIVLPKAYGGVAFEEGGKSAYIEEKPNRNPWEQEEKQEQIPPPKTAEEPSPAASVFGLLKNVFPTGSLQKGLSLPSFLLKLLPPGKEKPKGGNREEENLMLLCVAAILFLSPLGDKKAAVLLLLVYFLA